jgi:hypothetical protein
MSVVKLLAALSPAIRKNNAANPTPTSFAVMVLVTKPSAYLAAMSCMSSNTNLHAVFTNRAFLEMRCKARPRASITKKCDCTWLSRSSPNQRMYPTSQEQTKAENV